MWGRVMVWWWRRLWLPAVVALFALLIHSTVSGERGLFHLLRLSEEQRQLEDRVRVLLRENTDLKERRRRLRTDDFFLEKVAREGLGLARENEIIYRFLPDRAPRPQ